MKMDGGHVKVVWAARPQKVSHVTTDFRRRVYTPSLTLPRPVVRRASLDGGAVLKSKTLTVKRESPGQSEQPLHRSHSFRDVIVRDSAPRVQTTVPTATKLTHEPELKPILKTGKGTYVLKSPDASEKSSDSKGSAGSDGKCCYKLPDKPEPKLRKSVSFKEDKLTGTRKSYKRHLSSPILSLPNGVRGHYNDGQIFV